MINNSVECLRVQIDTKDPDFQIYPDPVFKKYSSIGVKSLSFTLNYNNISAQNWNNILYLNTLGTSSIVLADGCYDIDDINTFSLGGAIGGLFYKIHALFDG